MQRRHNPGVILRLAVALACLAVFAPGAHAAKSCREPGAEWQRATPAEAGMDAAKLQDAMDYGSSQQAQSLRVYRHGCLVGEDRAAPVNRSQQFQSYSMAKSVTALIFGRAMTLGLISPDDPVGSLLPEADGPHGDIVMRDLLTMTSGLEWNGFRDYNVFTMPDRVRDALTLKVVHRPGGYYEYAQSAVALLAEAVGRAAGQDIQAFAQRELMDPLGIPADAWRWDRDPAGHVMGFYGVHMRPDDYGRLGDLMRRKGVWRNRRLLSQRFHREAIAPSETNGCYGWLIWVNKGKPCVGVRISDRPVKDARDMPELPADMYNFSGLFGQRVTLFPTQDIVIVRTGQDPGLIPAGQPGWENELYKRVLGAITDEPFTRPSDAGTDVRAANRDDPDRGFQNAIREPERYSKGLAQDPLPPAGPERARAARLRLAHPRASRTGGVSVRMTCPARWPGREGGRACVGRATLEGTRRRLSYAVRPGATTLLRFRLLGGRLREVRRSGSMVLRLAAYNEDAGGGVPSRIYVRLRGPAPKRR